MIDTPDAAASDLRQAKAGTRYLTLACATLQMLADLDDLSHAGRARWMTLGDQAAARIDGYAAA